MKFLFSLFQIIKNFIYILRILIGELILVFNKGLTCLHEAIIIGNLVKSDNILINSLVFIQGLLFFEDSVSFLNFCLINSNNYWLEFFCFFWWLVVSDFKFFVSWLKIFEDLIYILLILSSKLFFLINELLAELHVFFIVMVSFLNSVHLTCLWKKHAKSEWCNELWF